MRLYQEPVYDALAPCPYLPDKLKQYQYFLAGDLETEELTYLLSRGWRKFGFYYFRPLCPSCRQCVPLRVLAQQFSAGKSQRRNLRKNADIRVKFGPLRYSKRAYEIYRDHSLLRFNQPSDEDDFLQSFFQPSCPAMQSEYYLDDELIAIGFLDMGSDCLSSVYFCFDTRYSDRGLGTFSALKEIEYTRYLELDYYYLGYYIQDSKSMAYKNRFHPNEQYNWRLSQWEAGCKTAERKAGMVI